MSIKDDYQEYKNALNELKINSKPLINFLTMLAEEKIYNAPQIVRAIEERIVEVNRKEKFVFRLTIESIALFSFLFLFVFRLKVMLFFMFSTSSIQ